MGVEIRYYAAGTTETFESFLTDVNNAQKEAEQASDPDGGHALTRLWLDYFEFLRNMSERKLVEYLEGRQRWRQYQEWFVLKTIDQPCIAYAAQIASNPGHVTLVALGACYRYPNGTEDGWWNATILPRLRRIR
jgi:hypothetical protein